MKNLKKIFIIIVTFIFVISCIEAAEPCTEEGSKSIFYGFNGLSDLSVENSYIGFQYLFADRQGLWIDFGLSFVTDKPRKDSEDITSNDFSIALGYIYYIFQKGPVACYLAPQFALGFGSKDYPDEVDQIYSKKTSNMFVIGCSIGSEWWFTEHVSLIFLTNIGYVTEKTKIEYISNNKEEESTKSIFGIIPESGASIEINFHF